VCVFSAVTTFYHDPNGAVHRFGGAPVEPQIYKNLIVFCTAVVKKVC